MIPYVIISLSLLGPIVGYVSSKHSVYPVLGYEASDTLFVNPDSLVITWSKEDFSIREACSIKPSGKVQTRHCIFE